MSSSPQYVGYFSPTYDLQLTNDAGTAINLTGVNISTGFTLIMLNTRTGVYQHGIGTWTITDAVNGKVSYQWTTGDLATEGVFLTYVTIQLPSEPSPRAFDPDTIIVVPLEKGNVAVSTQDVNILQVNGAIVSSANPVPISGPVTTADGGNVTLGAKGDAAVTDPTVSATEIALLKGLIKILALQSVAVTGASGAFVDGAIATLGTEADAAWSGSGSGTGVAILKKIVALLTATQTISGTVTANLAAGTNVIGHVIIDSAGSVSVTSLPSLPAGANVIGHVVVDSGTVTVNTISNYASETGGNLAAAKADLDTIVTNTGHIPTLGQAVKSASVPVTLASDQGDIPVKGDFTEMASLSAGSLNADLVPSTDVSAYKWLSLHINSSAYSGTLSFQASNDNVNWTNVNLLGGTGLNNASTTTTTTNIIFVGPVGFRYFRVRMTSYASGTAQGTLELYTSIGFWIFNSFGVTQSGTWTVQMPTSATGTITSVAAAVSDTSLLASNASRKGMYVFNDSAATLYLSFASSVSTSSYTVQIPANGFFEMPTAPVYTGAIHGIWSAANGNARITEMS